MQFECLLIGADVQGQGSGAAGDYQKYMSDYQQYMQGHGGGWRSVPREHAHFH